MQTVRSLRTSPTSATSPLPIAAPSNSAQRIFPEPFFHYASHNRRGSGAAGLGHRHEPHAALDSARLSHAVSLLSAGQTFARVDATSFHTMPGTSNKVTLRTTDVHVFCAPLNDGYVELALWWCVPSSDGERVKVGGQHLPFSEIFDVWKGAMSDVLKTAQSVSKESYTPLPEEECLVLQSKSHSISLIAPSQSVRDAWVSAICVVLEVGLGKERKVLDSDSTPKPFVPPTPHRPNANTNTNNPNNKNDSINIISVAGESSDSNVHSVLDSIDNQRHPTMIRPPRVIPPPMTELELARVQHIADSKAHFIHDLRLTLAEMVHDSTVKLKSDFSTAATPRRAEFDSSTKRISTDFLHVLEPSLQRSDILFEAKAYAPTIFARLRRLYSISDSEFLSSVAHPDRGYNDLVVNSKSNSMFMYTHDNKYLIKSCTAEENKALTVCLLHSYFNHLANNPDTLLVKILGCFRLTILKPHNQVLYFIVMTNVFASPISKPIHVRFDLKGSSLGRQATDEELLQQVPVLKDNDFFQGRTLPDGRKMPPTYLHMGEKRVKLLKQLNLDTEFLREHEIIDYSLLVGIHYSHYDRSDGSSGTGAPVAPNTYGSPVNGGTWAADGIAPPSSSHSLSIQLPPTTRTSTANSSSNSNRIEAQTNYGLQPHKQTLVPRSMLRKATMTLLGPDEQRRMSELVNIYESNERNIESGGMSPLPPPLVPMSKSINCFMEADGGMISSSKDPLYDGTETYYFGVIDILQRYTKLKRLEKTVKGFIYEPVSTNSKRYYMHRFRLQH